MDNVVLELQIVSKSVYGNNRWCYLGIDASGNLLRPIPSLELQNEADFFWPQEFDVGAIYKFNVIQRNPESVPLPHRKDDIHVSYASKTAEATSDRVAALRDVLRNKAKPTIEEALSIPDGMMEESRNGREYVKEGSDCHSCGVVNKVSHLEIFELGRPFKEFDPKRCFLKSVGIVSL